MKVGMVGVGVCGSMMAGHVIKSGKFEEVYVYDVNREAMEALEKQGAKMAASVEEIGRICDVTCVIVAYDDQFRQVIRELATNGKKGGVIVANANFHPETVLSVTDIVAQAGMKIIDAAISFGLSGARAGTLSLTCGGAEADLEVARPVLECYANKIHLLGPIGSGMIAKSMNALLHWVHLQANIEVLLLGKTYGLDPKKMKEVLLQLPAQNGALARWDTAQYTWNEKDMDTILDLAQKRKLPVPLTGLVDQLIKLPTAQYNYEIMYTDKIQYLGRVCEAVPLGRTIG